MSSSHAQTFSVEGHWIDGKWQKSSSLETIAVENPTTTEKLGEIPAGTSFDTDKAINAAKAAEKAWSELLPQERGEFLSRIADQLDARADQIAETISLDMGMPLKFAHMIQTNLPISTFRQAASLTTTYPFVRPLGSSRVFMEPVGVVGSITPWNYPLHQIAAKVAMSLAAGCTTVLKPSLIAPFCTRHLIEATQEAELPEGVFNVVWGAGQAAGQRLAESPDVDMLSFTGSTRVGSLLGSIAAKSIKRVSLELGGKSASLVLPSADFERAVKSTVSNCFLNSGQTCSAWTRLLVPNDRINEVAEMAAANAAAFTVGDPLDPGSRLGPLVSKNQQETVLNYIQKGQDEGATLVCGGKALVDKGPGYFVEPTIFSHVDPGATIAQEEIFGPVLSIIGYDSEEQAISIANGTIYGLAGAVWAGDIPEAERVARQIRTGQIDINGGRYNSLAPFGGFKQSGHGREMGQFGLDDFVEAKSLQY